MKIKNSKQKLRKLPIALTIVIAVILLSVAGFFITRALGLFGMGSQTTTNQAEEKAEQTKNEQMIKEESVNNGSKPNPQTEQPNTNDKQTVSVTITSPTVQSVNSFKLRSFISIPTTEGSCTLTLTAENKQTIVKSVQGLQPSNQISGCPDFIITSSELSPGTWLATLRYESPGYEGLTTQDITVN